MNARLTLLVCGDRPPPQPEEIAGVACEVVPPPRLGADTQLYEVMAPGGEPPFRYSDPYRRTLRIHTKHVGRAPGGTP